MSDETKHRWHWDPYQSRFSKIIDSVVVHKWSDEMDDYADSLEAENAALKEQVEGLKELEKIASHLRGRIGFAYISERDVFQFIQKWDAARTHIATAEGKDGEG